MAHTKGVIRAFITLGKTGQAIFLAQTTHALTATGKNFVGVTLMADIPDEAVIWGVKYIMQGNSEFKSTKTG